MEFKYFTKSSEVPIKSNMTKKGEEAKTLDLFGAFY